MMAQYLFAAAVTVATSVGLPPWVNEQFALNFAAGFVDDSQGDVVLCVVNGLTLAQTGGQTWIDLNNKTLANHTAIVMNDLDMVFDAIPPVIEQCVDNMAAKDIAPAVKLMKNCCTTPKELIRHVGANIQADDAGRIETEFVSAMKAYKRQDPDFGGGHFGTALHMLIVSPWVTTTPVTTTPMPTIV